MPRVAYINKIKAECIEEFGRAHRDLDAGMRVALHEAGWLNYTAFLSGDGWFVVYLEPPVDLRTAQEALAADPAFVRWFERYGHCFEAPDSSRPQQMLIQMEEILHIN